MTFNLFFRSVVDEKNRIFASSHSTLAKISSSIFMYCAFTYKITPPRLNLFFSSSSLGVFTHFISLCVSRSRSFTPLYYNFFYVFSHLHANSFSFTKRWCQKESRLKHSAVQHSIKAFKRQCTTCMHNFFPLLSLVLMLFYSEECESMKISTGFFFIQLHCRRRMETATKKLRNLKVNSGI